MCVRSEILTARDRFSRLRLRDAIPGGTAKPQAAENQNPDKVGARALISHLLPSGRPRVTSAPMAADTTPAASYKKLTLDDVRDVAMLARLALNEERLQRLTVQLEPILGYIAKLNEVDTTGVEPMAHALPLHNVLREDVVEPSLPLEKVLQNAPETDGPFFKVPKVIGGDEDSAG